jgi:hypothetical protein
MIMVPNGVLLSGQTGGVKPTLAEAALLKYRRQQV